MISFGRCTYITGEFYDLACGVSLQRGSQVAPRQGICRCVIENLRKNSGGTLRCYSGRGWALWCNISVWRIRVCLKGDKTQQDHSTVKCICHSQHRKSSHAETLPTFLGINTNRRLPPLYPNIKENMTGEACSSRSQHWTIYKYV